MQPKILAFAGSARSQSFNKKLIRIAAAMATEAGADVTLIDLKDYPMPIYDGDVEDSQGLPENAIKFKQLLINHDGFLIAAPEYNSSITPLLKNAIDWASRAESDDEPPLVAFTGKTAALLSASPGGLGGMRGLTVVRSLLSNINVVVIPQQKALPAAYAAYDDDGALRDDKSAKAITQIVKQLVDVTQRLRDSS